MAEPAQPVLVAEVCPQPPVTDRRQSAAEPKVAAGRQLAVPLRAKRERPGAGVTAGETAPVPFVPRQRIDLGGVKSEMDRRAEAIEAARVRDVQAALAARFAGETAVCRCGGTGVGTLGPVPAWFGRDCIEGDCPLKGNGRG